MLDYRTYYKQCIYSLKKGSAVRGWIDQPSTLQPYHKEHGKKAIFHLDKEGNVIAGFVEGELSSMKVPLNSVSFGWGN